MVPQKLYVSVPEFYAGKCVFVTGGSGYLGKVLIEKLLYSCPFVEKVYVLLRDNKKFSAEQRLKNMFDEAVFSRIKKERPEALTKIVLVKGELTAKNLDLTPEDLQAIRANVSIVIHSAATVKFNEPLKTAIAINVDGTKNVLELCKTMERIDAFVHVSTAYCNCNRVVVEEKIYPPPMSLDEAYKLAKITGEDVNIRQFLHGLPNTYTFTKALAENLVLDTHGNVPTVIVRPSIVTPSASEPIPGWVDNWFGSTGILHATALGICRGLYSEYDNNLDVVPVDYVCNTILVAATKADRSAAVRVFNACSGSINPISLGDTIKLYVKVASQDRFNILPFPWLIVFSKRKWLIKGITNLIQIIGYVADLLLQVFRKKPRYYNITQRLAAIQKALSFFTARSWLMKSTNTLSMANSLSPEDYRLFPCNVRDLDWEEYFPKYYRGVKKFLVEGDSKIMASHSVNAPRQNACQAHKGSKM